MVLILALGGIAYAIHKDLKKQELKKRPLVAPVADDTRAHDTAATGEPSLAEPPKLLALSLGASALSLVIPPLALVAVPAVIYTLWITIKQTYQQLVVEKRVTVHVLLVLTAASGLLVSLLTLSTIGRGLLFLVDLNLLLGILAHNLARYIRQSTTAEMIDVFEQQTGDVWVVQGNLDHEPPTEMLLPLELLQRGDIVVVQAGETIPVDGQIVRGYGEVDQRLLTGEAQPSEKAVGQQVFALTTVVMGKLYIAVEKTGQDTAAAHIGQLLNQTLNYKAGMQLWVEEISDKSVIPTLALGAVMWPLTGPAGSWALFVSHPKYKPTVVTYINIFTYLHLAMQAGILIKDGRVLERLNEVDTLVFDKTGTLTAEQPHLEAIYDWGEVGEALILTCAAVAEQKQSHPIAQTILQEAQRRGLRLPEVDNTAYRVGYGITVTLGQRKIYVGSQRFMVDEEQLIPAEVGSIQQQCHENGHSLVLVAVNGRVIGGIELRPRLRPEARRIVATLRQRGITEMYIVSGDHETPTRKLAEKLGINNYHAETLPEDKATLINQLQQVGKTVCYVGDGINDALALRSAAVSVSLKGASTVAVDVAQVVLMDQTLSKLGVLFDIAHHFEQDMRRTVGAVVVPHLVSLGGVLVLGMGGLSAIALSQLGLALGIGSALLPTLAAPHNSHNTPVRLAGLLTAGKEEG